MFDCGPERLYMYVKHVCKKMFKYEIRKKKLAQQLLLIVILYRICKSC